MVVLVVLGVLVRCLLWATVTWIVVAMLLLNRSDAPAGMIQIKVAIPSLCNYVEIIRVAFSDVGSVTNGHASEEVVNHKEVTYLVTGDL